MVHWIASFAGTEDDGLHSNQHLELRTLPSFGPRGTTRRSLVTNSSRATGTLRVPEAVLMSPLTAREATRGDPLASWLRERGVGSEGDARGDAGGGPAAMGAGDVDETADTSVLLTAHPWPSLSGGANLSYASVLTLHLMW